MKDQVVMITGAAGVLGRAVAEAFDRAGARLALVDLREDALKSAYPSTGAGATYAADLTDQAAAARTVEQVVARFKRVDALCNIAGGFRMGTPVHATDDATWDLLLGLNVGTMLNAVRAVVPRMLEGGGGRIVNVGAMGGMAGRANMGAYSASKSAVIRLTEAMAAELRDKGINVNCVLPSVIDTPANRADMPKANPAKWVAPADLAAVIRFLCSDDARALHGAAIPVVGLS
ncbi:MAG TPA: SDR family NAD(P)-dependent oxidoreductase [Candidatus Binatia bacterium]|nr:SDR family NAD(P)-dependent oxidoreductase [Candidatus Binatia bacterium]